MSILMVDVDHFKQVNDRHGHQLGDVVLAAIAQGIQATLRTPDLVARFGGEEFAIILPDTALEEATRAAERVRMHIREQRFGNPRDAIQVTISVGIATLEKGETRDDLIFRADGALLEAKRSGRDRITLASEAGLSSSSGDQASA
jgi:diguanylate cyclase (GGDEF)-like protein